MSVTSLSAAEIPYPESTENLMSFGQLVDNLCNLHSRIQTFRDIPMHVGRAWRSKSISLSAVQTSEIAQEEWAVN